jgi:hypothetical protein
MFPENKCIFFFRKLAFSTHNSRLRCSTWRSDAVVIELTTPYVVANHVKNVDVGFVLSMFDRA